MKYRALAGWLLALGPCYVACGGAEGDDAPTMPTAGAPAAGSVSTAGAAGAGATGGSSVAGSGVGGAVAGGAASAGSAGSAGSEAAGSGGIGGAAPSLPAGTPSTVLLDGAVLKQAQQALATDGTPEQKAALANLIAAADIALKSGTWSVTTKPKTYVVNDDPHEYVSWGPYWWPSDAKPPNDPGTFGKCPYVSRDGIHNPDVAKVTDRHALHASSEAIFELALAWYFTGDDRYADQAALVARTFYLDAATAMSPNMNHGQSRGPCGAGTATGIIEAAGYLTDALDGLAILALDTRSNGWKPSDVAGMKTWLGKYADWLKTSAIGKAEGAASNNHGTWYDATLASIYLYVGDSASAKTLLNGVKAKRIDSQIESDGRQLEELARPTSWHYSNYNAAAFCRIAGIAKHVDIDLWSYTSPKGGSIVKAMAFLLPTASSKTLPGPWSQFNDITKPFDPAYQAEAYYTIHALADYASHAGAKAVFAQSPVPMMVPGHYCAGDRFPLGSNFCAITPGAAPFADLQAEGTPAVDMWSLIPTCRVPIN